MCFKRFLSSRLSLLTTKFGFLRGQVRMTEAREGHLIDCNAVRPYLEDVCLFHGFADGVETAALKSTLLSTSSRAIFSPRLSNNPFSSSACLINNPTPLPPCSSFKLSPSTAFCTTADQVVPSALSCAASSSLMRRGAPAPS